MDDGGDGPLGLRPKAEMIDGKLVLDDEERLVLLAFASREMWVLTRLSAVVDGACAGVEQGDTPSRPGAAPG